MWWCLSSRCRACRPCWSDSQCRPASGCYHHQSGIEFHIYLIYSDPEQLMTYPWISSIEDQSVALSGARRAAHLNTICSPFCKGPHGESFSSIKKTSSNGSSDMCKAQSSCQLCPCPDQRENNSPVPACSKTLALQLVGKLGSGKDPQRESGRALISLLLRQSQPRAMLSALVAAPLHANCRVRTEAIALIDEVCLHSL